MSSLRKERSSFTGHLIRVMLPALKFGGHLLNNFLVLFQMTAETVSSLLQDHHRVTLVLHVSNAASAHCPFTQCVLFCVVVITSTKETMLAIIYRSVSSKIWRKLPGQFSIKLDGEVKLEPRKNPLKFRAELSDIVLIFLFYISVGRGRSAPSQCSSVSRIKPNSTWQIFMNLGGGVQRWPRKNPINSGMI